MTDARPIGAASALRTPTAERRHSRRSAPLLGLDPELGRLLTGERAAVAQRELLVEVFLRTRGPWPVRSLPPGAVMHLGLLVLDGVLAADVVLEDTVSTELLGPGDLLRPWPSPAPEGLMGDDTSWTVLADCHVAVLDYRCAASLARYPEIYAVLVERMDLRARRLATTQAIAALNRVDRRLLAILWHLAERWGRVTRGGVLVPLALSHRLLGQLVGARRPTVSSAVAQLVRDGALQRRPDGTWLLLGEPATGASPPSESLQPHRHTVAGSEPGGSELDALEFRLRRLRREADALQRELELRSGFEPARSPSYD
jgi:CRP/FNR family cyclic AMP-dependent transcriptional regulator